MQARHASQTCKPDMQARHASQTCKPDMQARHASQTCKPDMQAIHASQTCKPDMQAIHASQTCKPDMQARHASQTCKPDMLGGQGAIRMSRQRNESLCLWVERGSVGSHRILRTILDVATSLQMSRGQCHYIGHPMIQLDTYRNY